jgi:hypothetical protein
MHDLLRAYAAELAGSEDDADDRRAVLTRLFDHYLVTAAAAMHALHSEGRPRQRRQELRHSCCHRPYRTRPPA